MKNQNSGKIRFLIHIFSLLCLPCGSKRPRPERKVSSTMNAKWFLRGTSLPSSHIRAVLSSIITYFSEVISESFFSLRSSSSLYMLAYDRGGGVEPKIRLQLKNRGLFESTLILLSTKRLHGRNFEHVNVGILISFQF
jgi:hypothetical protein